MQKSLRYSLPLIILLGAGTAARAQTTGRGVGIGTTTPHASALLDLSSVTKGLLAPRMTAAERGNIASPAAGLLVYQTDGVQLGFWYYTGAAWTYLSPTAAGDNLGSHTATQNLNLADKLLVGNGGSSGLSISNAGRVGIGTSNPAQKLDVAGSLSSTTVGTEGLFRLTRPDNSGVKYASTAEWRLGAYAGGVSAASRLDLVLGNGNTNSPEATVLTALGSGNVGIGTTAPSQKLEVAGQVFSSTGGFRFPDNTVQTTAAAPDNLGNHTATQNLNLADKLLVGNGGTSGLSISNGGGVGIGTTGPAASALLDLTSSGRGLLIPRLLASQRAAISSPATGLLVYQTNGSPGFYYFDGLNWLQLPSGLVPDAQGNVPTGAAAQYGAATVGTEAGTGVAGPQNGPSTIAQFDAPRDVVRDANGVLYVTEVGAHRIRKITPDGTVSTLAGSTTAGYQDGPGASARFSSPTGLAIDGNGVLYVADLGNRRIRKVQPDGTVSTLAGSGTAGFQDGPGASARFQTVQDVAVDAAGVVYVADEDNSRIRKVQPDGTVSTLVGTGVRGFQDGPLAMALLNWPLAVEVGPGGVIYVADSYNYRIRKILPDGTITTLAGSGTAGYQNGAGPTAQFDRPGGLAIDATGVVYVSDIGSSTVRQVLPDGTVSTLAGSGVQGFQDGPGASARFNLPRGLALGATGTLYVADMYTYRVRRISRALTANAAAATGNQQLSISGTSLALTNGGAVALPQQQLGLSGTTLTLTNSGSVTLPQQQLSKLGATISLTNGGSVTDSDNQSLNVSGQTLSISGGNNVTLPTDNLGNHAATQNLNLGTSQLVGNGGSSGLRISSDGNVGIGASTPIAPLEVVRDNASAYALFHDPNDHYFSFGQDRNAGNNIKISDGNGFGGTNFLTIQRSNGNVGIGTSSPGQKLDVAGSARLSGGLIVDNVNANNGTIGSGSAAVVFGGSDSGEGIASNRGSTNGNQYGLDFYTGFIKRVSISNTGYMGIGTTGPAFPLDVQGSVTPGNFAYGFLNGSGSVGTTGSNTGPVSIRASGRMVATEFNATSDRRLKTIVGLSDRAADLALLQRLRITDYTMRDRVQYGTRQFKKVIAQEVEEVFPQAVSQHAGFLPDVYQLATTAASVGDSLLRLTLPAPAATLVKAGQRVKLVSPAGEVIGTVKMAGGRELLVRGAGRLAGQQVFVFGLEHPDVRTVDYEALSMLNVSATQELARKVAELEQQNAALRAQSQAQSQRLDQQQTSLQTQAAQTTELAQRLKALESLLGARAEVK